MAKGKIAGNNERVIVNRDFSIHIPEGYNYSLDTGEINDNRVLVFIKTERNDYFDKEFGDFDEFDLDAPFGAPQCCTIVPLRNLGVQLDLSDSNIREVMRNMFQPIATMFGGTCTAVKETKDMLVYFSKFNGKEKNTHFLFVTPENIYNGQIWLNDISTQKERERIAKEWLNSIENYVLTDADKIPSKPFVVPTYNEKKREQMGTLTIAVPDQMKTLISESEKGRHDFIAIENLKKEFAFLAINNEFKGAFNLYSDAEFIIKAANDGIKSMPNLVDLWGEEKKAERKKALTDLVKNSLQGNPYKFVFKDLANELSVVYTQVGESTDNIEQWANFFAIFFHKDAIVQVNIHIKAVLDATAMEKAVASWVASAKPASKEEIAKYNAMKTTKLLGPLAGENGKIDGVKGTQLFFEDVFFFVKGQLLAKGRHHELKGIQVNAQVIDNYPQIKDNLSVFGTALTDLINFVEEDELLVLDEECVHFEFDKLNKIDPPIINGTKVDVKGAKIGKGLSGARMFLLIAWHMAKIVENEKNSYIVALDGNILRGIPAAKAYICQFIKRLREYNDIADDFSVTFAATLNLEGGMDAMITGINPMHSKSFNDVVSVKKGVSPYESIQKMILTEKANGTWTQWNRGKDGEDNEFEVDFFEGLDAFDSKDSNFETTQTVEKKSVIQKEINKHEESLKKQNESIAELKKIAKENEKLIKEVLNKVKETHRSAEREFDKAKAEIERSSSRTISLEYDDVGGRILDAIVGATEASRDLYNSCQSLVLILDTACRPLVTDAVSDSLVNDIYREIQSLNEDSDIDNDYTGTLDDYFLGDLANVHFEPTDDAKQIEKYWRYKCSEQKENNQKIEYLTKNNILEKDIEKHKKYLEACHLFEFATKAAEVKEAKKIFTSLSGYLDSLEFIKKCDDKLPNITKKEKAAKKKASEEKKRIAEEKKAEEERIRQEMEMQKKLAEERILAEKEENKILVKEYLSKLEEFKKQVRKEVKLRTKEFVVKTNEQIQDLSTQKLHHESKLNSLGFFKFSEKKSEKNAISSLESQIEYISKPEYIKNKENSLRDKGNKAIADYKKAVEVFLEQKYNLNYGYKTKEISIDAVFEYEIAKMRSKPSVTRRENLYIELQILKFIHDAGKAQNAEEIATGINAESVQKISALIRMLGWDNCLYRTKEQGCAYFSLTEQGRDRLHKAKLKHDTTKEYVVDGSKTHLKCPVAPKVSSVFDGEN